MKQTITNILKTISIRYKNTENILDYKQYKLASTNYYLQQHRNVYKPHVPMGFKSRQNNEYYLTSNR